MRRNVLLGALLVCGWLVSPACGTGEGGNDAGRDGGTDSGQTGSDAGPDAGTPDSGTPDAGSDAGVPSCTGYNAPTVPLQIASACPGFTACGGNPAGRWVYDAGCAVSPFTNLTGVCSGVTISNTSGTISGCLSFSGALAGTVERRATWTITATATFPSSCVPSDCAALQTAVRTYYPGATCSAVTGGGCACTLSSTGSVNDGSAFSVSGTDILAGGGTYPFCVTGGAIPTMKYRETGSSPSVPEADLARR